MFEYKQRTGNKRVIIIFTALFCIIGALLIFFDIKTLVIVLFILISIIGYIAFMKFRLFGSRFMGANVLRPHRDEPLDLVNLNINNTADNRKTLRQDQYNNAYEMISQVHNEWKKRLGPGNYLKDRDAFYSYLKQQVLTNWLKSGGEKAVFMDVMVQYARNDWLSAGGSAEDFDKQLRAARRDSKK